MAGVYVTTDPIHDGYCGCKIGEERVTECVEAFLLEHRNISLCDSFDASPAQ